MITIVSRFFINSDMTEAQKRTVFGYICGGVGIFLNIILFSFKLFAGLISGAVSITADAFNNLSDAGSSIVTLLGFKLAGHKPDADHPYGHGRIEYIAGFVVATTIIVMGFELIKESVIKIIHPSPVEFSTLVVVILLASIATKLYMAFYNFSVGKKIDSAPVKATAFDSLSDSIATTAVLVATVVGHVFDINIDGFAGVLVSLFIFCAGYNAAKEALNPLLGTPPEPEFIKEIQDIVLNFDKNVVGLHDLMVHDYGPGRRIISLHAEVPADGDILELHDIIDVLEKTIDYKLGCVTTIHMDPVAVNDPQVNALKDQVQDLVKEIHERCSIHDFRVVFGDTHTNLVFDIAVPFECTLSNKECIDKARNLIFDKIGNTYFAVIEIDRDNYIEN